MNTVIRTAAAAAILCAFAAPAIAQDSLGIYAPEAIGAAAYGSTEPIVHVPLPNQTRAQTVAPIDVTNMPQVAAAPAQGQRLDMSGADGTLRACYENGGMARQNDDFQYTCNYDASTTAVTEATDSPYITPQGVDTGYSGTSNVEDPALVDCVSRGGTLIQLAGNQQFACAM